MTTTVMARFHVKEGKEAEFERVHTEAWQAYLRLDLIQPTPHLVLRGKEESGKTYYVEILTWKDVSVTGNPPEEVRALWMQLNEACEARNGHQAIEFPAVEILHFQ